MKRKAITLPTLVLVNDDNDDNNDPKATKTSNQVGLPTSSEIIDNITIPFMQSIVPSTPTYQANESTRRYEYMINILASLDTLKHVPTVVLSIICEYSKSVHADCVWLVKSLLMVFSRCGPNDRPNKRYHK